MADAPPRALVVFDMDRTLLDGKVIAAIGARFGVEEPIRRLIAERDAGRASRGDVTAGVAALLRGHRLADFDAAVGAIPLMRGALEAVEALRRAGLALALCSESYTRAAEPLARRLHIPLWAAHVLEDDGQGRFTGRLAPWAPALGLAASGGPLLKKPEAVPLLAAKAGVSLALTALVGDGDPDAAAMPLVGLPIAFNGTPKARAAARHLVEGSLEPVPGLVLGWLADLRG